MRSSVSISSLLDIARGLKSEDNENSEYDRALVELVTEASGLPLAEKELMAKMLGIELLDLADSDLDD